MTRDRNIWYLFVPRWTRFQDLVVRLEPGLRVSAILVHCNRSFWTAKRITLEQEIRLVVHG